MKKLENKNGKLYIVATPIGNLADITLRALDILKSVDLILCEDTRVTSKLLNFYGISKSLMSYNDHSDQKTREAVINKLSQGLKIALVSDAGTPLISDPGYKLIHNLRTLGFNIETVPGPCSIIAALTIAGIPTDKFTFIGFLPNKKSAKEKLFVEFQNIQSSLICFESANRLLETVESIKEIFPYREIVIVKEITKLFEQVVKGNAEYIENYFIENKDRLKGEIVLLIAPPGEESFSSQTTIKNLLQSLLKDNSLRDAVEIASSQFKHPKKDLYKLGLSILQEIK